MIIVNEKDIIKHVDDKSTGASLSVETGMGNG